MMFIKKIIFIILSILLIGSFSACDNTDSHFDFGEENYIAFKEQGKYGFMLPTGKVIIDAKYDYVQPFRFGYSMVSKDGQLLIVDTLGNEIDTELDRYRPAEYIGHLQFTKDGVAKIFKQDSMLRFIDTKANTLFEKSNQTSFSEINDQYIRLSAYFEDGLIPAHKLSETNSLLNECVYLDKNGEIALDNDYLTCSSFSDGLAAVEIARGSLEEDTFKQSFVFINPLGEVVIESNLTEVYQMFDGIQPVVFKDGYAIGRFKPYLASETSPAKYMVIDNKGEIVIEFDADRPVDVSGDYVLTRNSDGFYAIFDLTGKMIMDYTYKSASNQSSAIGIFDNLVVLKNEDNKYGAIDVNTGQVSIDFEYDYMAAFNGGYTVVKKNGLYGVIDTKGNISVDISYEDMISVTRTIIYSDILS